MPTYGGYSPYPRRFGGGKRRLQIIHETLNAQRGTAYSKDSQSVVWVENMAIARSIDASWSTNQRLANQADPRRMTSLLERWERMLAIPVSYDATEADRRAEVLLRMQRIGREVIHSRLYAEVVRVLGPFFVAIEYIDLSLANVHVPDDTYPWGTVAAGAPWYSTIAHVLILMEKPGGATEADFWEKANALAPVVDAILPIDVTWDWYHSPQVGTPINLAPRGPSRAGWYLDEPNLDRLVFDSISSLVVPLEFVHLWDSFDGTTWIDSIAGLNGTPRAAGVPLLATLNGRSYPVFSEAGVNGLSSAHMSDLDGLSDWTIVYVFKTGDLNLFTKLMGQPFSFFLESSGGTRVAMYGNGPTIVVGTSLINDGNWHRVVITSTAGSVDLYVDGVLEATNAFGSLAVSAPDTQRLALGCGPNPFETFDGSILLIGVAVSGVTPTEAATIDAALLGLVT